MIDPYVINLKRRERMAYRIGDCLLSKRLEELDMTQAELARRLGVQRQQVGKWAKNEQRMSLESAKNVASILGLNHVDDLYEWVLTKRK
jgi:DNA-binding XRE family transcriptional regulator